MRQEYIDAFLGAVEQVFRELGIAIEGGSSGDGAEPPSDDDRVITSVGLTGDLRGIVMLRTDAAGASSLVDAMTGSFGVSLRSEAAREEMQMAALAELSNQISGRAITLLSEHGVTCDITPPTAVAAHGLRTLAPDIASSVRRTVRGSFGRLSIYIGTLDAGTGPRGQKTS